MRTNVVAKNVNEHGGKELPFRFFEARSSVFRSAMLQFRAFRFYLNDWTLWCGFSRWNWFACSSVRRIAVQSLPTLLWWLDVLAWFLQLFSREANWKSNGNGGEEFDFDICWSCGFEPSGQQWIVKFCLELVCSYFSLEDCCSKLSDVTLMAGRFGMLSSTVSRKACWKSIGNGQQEFDFDICLSCGFEPSWQQSIVSCLEMVYSGFDLDNCSFEVVLWYLDSWMVWRCFFDGFQVKFVEYRMVFNEGSLISILVLLGAVESSRSDSSERCPVGIWSAFVSVWMIAVASCSW